MLARWTSARKRYESWHLAIESQYNAIRSAFFIHLTLTHIEKWCFGSLLGAIGVMIQGALSSLAQIGRIANFRAALDTMALVVIPGR